MAEFDDDINEDVDDVEGRELRDIEDEDEDQSPANLGYSEDDEDESYT